MSTNTLFATAIADAKARESREAELQQEQAELNRRQQVAQAANDEAAKKRQLEFQRQVRTFADGFFIAVVKHAKEKKWSATAIEQAQAYCELLICHQDKQLPKIDPGIARVIHDRFAYGVALANDTIPANYFVGQRQDWFPVLHAEKLEAKANRDLRGTRLTQRISLPTK